MDGLMNAARFSFAISKKKLDDPFLNHTTIGEYFFSYDGNTSVQKSALDGRELLLFGLAIDVSNGLSEDIPDTILRHSKSINDVIHYEARLGGKYLIIYYDTESCYIIPDATASIPIFYTAKGNVFLCSSYEKIIVDSLCLKADPELQEIRKASEISQAMPYDVTCYREIKSLLPNHVLNCQLQTASRFVNASEKQCAITVEQAVRRTAVYIERMADFIVQHFEVYCPITSGKDSRVVLAYLDQACRKFGKRLLCYTIRHTFHTGNEDDLIIPKQLAMAGRCSYEQIRDEAATANTYMKMDAVFGKGRYSKRTALFADTIFKHYGNGAIINGDIMGQVGKCSLHRDIPQLLATPAYFKCKLHNYSCKSNKYIRDWIREIQQTGERVNLFDLFSVESRMGRWAAQENAIYNAKGQIYLNIFNSRSIIYVWTCVPRKQRKNADLQKAFIRRVKPELLTVPFESDSDFFIKISKSTGMFYYIGSRIKHILGYFKFKAGRQ